MQMSKTAAAAAAILLLAPTAAMAAETHGVLPGDTMSLLWALPFAGLLLCIATGPVLYAHFWEHHFGKITAAWSALVIVPMLFSFGWAASAEAVLHTLLL